VSLLSRPSDVDRSECRIRRRTNRDTDREIFQKETNNSKEKEMTFTEQDLKPEIVSEAEWLIARRDLLAREKEFTRERDALAAARRKLPMVKVGKQYVFEGPNGKESLGDLFGDSSQLIVYHFMLGPGWEEGCKSCSYLADHFDGANWHLPHRDVALVVVSRAPFAELKKYQQRMGWKFKWVSSHGTNFNFDYHVSFTEQDEKKGEVLYNYEMQDWMAEELPGLSVFYKDANGDVLHSYSTYGRGLDGLVGTYNFLDLVPKGRNENPESTMDWVRRHDEYEAVASR
jgi:predicted dithiol-disulfide oxidoreductase (DUF899 family)